MSLLRKIISRYIVARWQLVWVDNSIEELIAGQPLRWQPIYNPYEDCWFADPFIVEADADRVLLLAEEYSLRTCRGHVALITVCRRQRAIVDRRVVWQDDSHYSFPFIVGQDVRYIDFMPENHDNGRLAIYRYDRQEGTAEMRECVAHEPLTDAVMWQGKLWATHEDDRFWDRLGIYAGGADGYEKEGEQVFRENIARNAGAFFEVGGQTYRPAQVCNKMYGEGISIQRVETIAGQLRMEEVRRFSVGDGMHSLAVAADVVIADRKLFWWPWLSKTTYRLLGKSDR